jgi:NADH-quinone oxidoreductase subunit E
MLTEEERQEILAEVGRSERPEAATVEALMAVQKRRGWVSDASLGEISGLLGMTPAELDAVATFYSGIYRRPVGRHVIALCDSMACWTLGYEALYERLSAKLGVRFGGTTQDNRFTLLPASCLGACDRAPAMLVDDELYGPVTPEDIEKILNKYQ